MRRRKDLRTGAVLAGLAFLLAPEAARALQSMAQTTEHAGYSIITANEGVGREASLRAALAIGLNPGWHSYWRMPGEGGLAPSFDWTDSKNVRGVTVRWPVPQRFEQLGMYSFGYTGRVLLPLDVTLDRPGQAAVLSVKAEIMVCNDICIPQHVTLRLDIPAGPARPSPDAPRIADAVKALPHAGDMPALKIESAVIGPKALVVRAWSQTGFDKTGAKADLFAEVKDGAFYFTLPPKIEPDKKDPRGATITLSPPDGTANMADALMHHAVTLTLVKDDKAIEKRIDF